MGCGGVGGISYYGPVGYRYGVMWRLIPQYIPHIRCACVSHGALAVWPARLLRYCNGQASEAQRGSKASSRLPPSVSGLVTLPRRVAATFDGIQQTCRLRNRAVTRPVARSPGRTPTVRRFVSRPHATSRSPCRTGPPPAAAGGGVSSWFCLP